MSAAAAFTILEFGNIALAAMRQLGVWYAGAELEDLFHFWRYGVFLNGVGPELNPGARPTVCALRSCTR